MSSFISDCKNYYAVSGVPDSENTPSKACDNCIAPSETYIPQNGYALGGPCEAAPHEALEYLPEPVAYLANANGNVYATANISAAQNYVYYDNPKDACKNKSVANNNLDAFAFQRVGHCENIENISLPVSYVSNGRDWYYYLENNGYGAQTPLAACSALMSEPAISSDAHKLGTCRSIEPKIMETFQIFNLNQNYSIMICVLILLILAILCFFLIKKFSMKKQVKNEFMFL